MKKYKKSLFNLYNFLKCSFQISFFFLIRILLFRGKKLFHKFFSDFYNLDEIASDWSKNLPLKIVIRPNASVSLKVRKRETVDDKFDSTRARLSASMAGRFLSMGVHIVRYLFLSVAIDPTAICVIADIVEYCESMGISPHCLVTNHFYRTARYVCMSVHRCTDSAKRAASNGISIECAIITNVHLRHSRFLSSCGSRERNSFFFLPLLAIAKLAQVRTHHVFPPSLFSKHP